MRDGGVLGFLTFDRENDGGLSLAGTVGGPTCEGACVLREGLFDVQDGRVALHKHLQVRKETFPVYYEDIYIVGTFAVQKSNKFKRRCIHFLFLAICRSF